LTRELPSTVYEGGEISPLPYDGRAFRILNVIDEGNPEALATERGPEGARLSTVKTKDRRPREDRQGACPGGAEMERS
jgi:hypothetical protein